jgi:uncharacterized membrane protein
MAIALPALLGRKQYIFLIACVEGNISTINNLASLGVRNPHYFNKFSQPRRTQGHYQREITDAF